MDKIFISVLMAVLMITAFAVPTAAQPGPLTLEQCVAMALQSNLRIETANEKLLEMDAAIEEAGAANMPKLSAQASYTRVIPQPKVTVPVGVDLTAPSAQFGFAPIVPYEVEVSGNVYNLGLTVTQLLYTGGKIKNAQKITRHGRSAAEWQKKSAVREIRRDVTKAYYQALAANKGVVALDSAIALMEVMLRDLGNAVEVGMRGEHELLQAQVQLANQKLARQQAATGAQMAHDYLATLMGIPVSTPITLANELHAPDTFSVLPLDILQTRARDASTDLKALKEQQKIVETSLLITGNSILTPTVLAMAGYNGQGIGQGRDGRWENTGNISLVAQWDIYDFGAANNKRRQTLSQKRQLELTMDNIGINLDMMVKNSCASLQDAFAGIETGKKSIAQTKRSYEISYDKFQEGMMLSSEVLNAQNMTLQAEISYYAALSNFYARQADLDYLVNEEK